jgi:hypothetical protein
MHLFMWARTPAADSQVNLEFLLLDAADERAGYKFDAFSITTGVVASKYEQFPMVSLLPPMLSMPVMRCISWMHSASPHALLCPSVSRR